MTTFWFIAITILWTGFLVLEGFDFGVGALHGLVGRTDDGRRDVIHTIGPVWDGNEVWLVVAGASMFAAFPGWYATAFSALYVPVVVLLVALIVRGVAIEFRHKRDTPRWRRGWSIGLIISSLVAPFVVGVALADFAHGLPIEANQEFVGNFADLIPPYSIVTGVAVVAMTLMHGAAFLSIKTEGIYRERSVRLARRISPVATLLVFAMVIWTHVTVRGGALLTLTELATLVVVLAADWLIFAESFGWAFVATSATLAGMSLTIFTDMYPNVLVSTISEANNLTVHNTSSANYSLVVMTIILVVLFPIVLAYQGWAYLTLRRRKAPATTG